jgi:cytochrome c biogenesis protein
MTGTTEPRTTPRERPAARSAQPTIPGPWETAVLAWRVLRRMSTALWLLFALAAASVVATFIPQEPVIPPTVRDWRAGVDGPGEAVAAVLDALGLFDVYGSWWFMTLTVLLIVSLTGCLVPRSRAFLRTVRQRPVGGRNLGRLANHAELDTALAPGEALAAAERLLRRRRFRTRHLTPDDAPNGVAQVAGERGHAREGGSLVFHVSFYVLLAGAVIGHAFGFVGQVNVVEGERFADTQIAYGGYQPGRFFGLDDHRGFSVQLDSFEVSYHPVEDPAGEGHVPLVPREFVSHLTFLEDGEPVADGVTRVNHPVEHDGMKLYQVRFGFAPHVEVHTPGGSLLFEDTVMLVDEGAATWVGYTRVATSDVDNQLLLELVFLPDADLTSDGIPYSRTPEPRNPRLIGVLWYGPLGLERNIPAREFDRDAGDHLPQPVILAPGASGTFEPLGLEVTFADLPYYSGFQVSHEPGRWLLVVGSILLLGGLVPSLYSHRRRVWAEARPHEQGSRVTLAGVALQRKPRFAEAFRSLTDDLRAELPDATPAHTAAPVHRDADKG